MSEKPIIELPHLMPVLETLPDEEALEFLEDLLDTFNEQIESRLPQLHEALKQRRKEPLRDSVHFVAGSASNMGMTRLCTFCRSAEAAIKNGTFARYDSFETEFNKELASGRAAFRELLNSYSS